MTCRQSRFALLLVMVLLIVLPACEKKPPVESLGPMTITLAISAGQCTQNGSSGVLDVEDDQNVTYQLGAQGANPQFNVQFSSCPFASANCPVNSPQGTSQNPGTPIASASGNTYYYSSVTVNNQTCTNGSGTFGMHIKPGTMRPR